MKKIVSKFITIIPALFVIVVGAYIIEEIIEDLYSEALSDFVYPIAALLIFWIIWVKLIPIVQTYLREDTRESN
jgi:hypothetical protein